MEMLCIWSARGAFSSGVSLDATVYFITYALLTLIDVVRLSFSVFIFFFFGKNCTIFWIFALQCKKYGCLSFACTEYLDLWVLLSFVLAAAKLSNQSLRQMRFRGNICYPKIYSSLITHYIYFASWIHGVHTKIHSNTCEYFREKSHLSKNAIKPSLFQACQGILVKRNHQPR